jgi:hypothetical protein
MTKAEARKLANDIIDYFCKLVEFERRSDISLYVCEDDYLDGEYDGLTQIFESHGQYAVKLFIDDSTKRATLINTICHELAHVFTNEDYTHHQTYIGDADDGDSIARLNFMQGFERIAKRYAVVLAKLWETKNKLEALNGKSITKRR